MKALIKHFKIQLLMDIRNKSTLLTFYIIPLLFYAVMGAVFSSIQPAMRQTLGASISIFAITMGAVLGIPPSLVNMRESGTLRAYRVSGVPGWSVLLTKSASAFINLLVVAMIIFFTAPIFFKAGIPVNMPAFFITLVLLIMVSIIIGVMIGVLAKNQSMATILSQLVFLPSLMLAGIMFPSTMLPGALQWLGRVLPASHAMESFRGWSFGLESGISPLTANAVMVGIGLIGIIVAIMRFKKISMEN